MKRILLFYLLILPLILGAQENDRVILEIDGEKVTESDFIRVFKKNLDLVKNPEQKDPENYLELFINYKLKVKEAYNKALDKRPEYITEFEKYKDQLLNNYLTVPVVNDRLVIEAYERMQEEINAEHILIQTKGNDTTKAFDRAESIYDSILKKGFEVVKNEIRNEKEILVEQLGYFSVFTMVYPFETAAYNTKVGAVSKPVKTRFGYHIVKVNNRRKNQGTVKVAHILLRGNEGDDPKLNQKLDSVLNGIKNGVAFPELAKKYSDDINTASGGGVLPTISNGRSGSAIFDETVFALKRGEISKPFRTKYGLHIVKQIEKDSVGTLDEEQTLIVNRIKNDDRSKIIDKAFLEKISKEYQLSENGKIKAQVFSKLRSGEGITKELKSQELFQISGNKISVDKLFSYLGSPKNIRFKEDQLKKLYNAFLKKELLDYHKDHLEENNKEYADILKEYREGLLIFDLMQEEIWDKWQKDSTGIVKYYKENNAKYKTIDLKNLEEIRAAVGIDYQKYLEEEWIGSLRKKYRVVRLERNLKKMIKKLNKTL